MRHRLCPFKGSQSQGLIKLVTPYVQLQTLKLNLYDDETCYNHAIDFDYWEKTNSSNSTDGDESVITDDINESPEQFHHYGYDYYGYDYYGYNYGNYYKTPYYPEHTLYNSEVEFCAGHYNMTTDTYTEDASSCYGDSGGPLGTDRRSYISLRGVS